MSRALRSAPRATSMSIASKKPQPGNRSSPCHLKSSGSVKSHSVGNDGEGVDWDCKTTLYHEQALGTLQGETLYIVVLLA
jgi:hypothetical protein